jgi:hypothetical protein
MLNWPHRSSTLPFALAGFGIAHFENNGPVAMRASRMCPFICVFSWPESEQQYEPAARFRANHHRDVDGALGHPTCP